MRNRRMQSRITQGLENGVSRSRVVLCTYRFDAMLLFYRDRLGFAQVDSWDQAHDRGAVLALPGMLLKIIDDDREPMPMVLGASIDRVGFVIEVDDIDEIRELLDIETPIPHTTVDGGRHFQLRDPDGLPTSFLQAPTRH